MASGGTSSSESYSSSNWSLVFLCQDVRLGPTGEALVRCPVGTAGGPIPGDAVDIVKLSAGDSSPSPWRVADFDWDCLDRPDVRGVAR
jgi:hypothetical protein